MQLRSGPARPPGVQRWRASKDVCLHTYEHTGTYMHTHVYTLTFAYTDSFPRTLTRSAPYTTVAVTLVTHIHLHMHMGVHSTGILSLAGWLRTSPMLMGSSQVRAGVTKLW